MGIIQIVPPVKPLAGLLAADREQLAGARAELTAQMGPVARETEPVRFEQTDYYTPEMGPGLWRQFLVFETLRDPEGLADWKRASNALEIRLGLNERRGRRVNVDPGYLAPGKLVLASTKDHMQRIYLRDGIYAEVTLRIQQGRFATWEWSYPDYAAARDFFDEAYREYLLQLRERGGPKAG